MGVDKFIFADDDGFQNFIKRESADDVMLEEDIIGRLIMHPIDIDCNIQYCNKIPNDIPGVTSTSPAETFNKDITIIHGKVSEKTQYSKINLLDSSKWLDKTKSYTLFDTNGHIRVYKIFAVVDNLSYDDIKDLDKTQLVDLLKDNSKFDFDLRVKKNHISVLMLNVGVIDDEWLIVGGYTE